MPRWTVRPLARELLSRYIASPLARVFWRLGLNPNSVTILGLLISLGAAYLVGAGHLLIGGAVLLGGSLLDMVDGALARLSGRATPLGALLDSTTDRISEAAVLFGLLFFYTTKEDSLAGVILVYLALVLSQMVSYLRARGEGLGVKGEVGLMTRPERVIVLSLGLMAGHYVVAPMVALGIIAGLSLITSLQRLAHIRRNMPPK